MTTKNCPFCGEPVMIVKKYDAWYFECIGTPLHRFQMAGMDCYTLSVDVLKKALVEWDRRVTE